MVCRSQEQTSRECARTRSVLAGAGQVGLACQLCYPKKQVHLWFFFIIRTKSLGRTFYLYVFDLGVFKYRGWDFNNILIKRWTKGAHPSSQNLSHQAICDTFGKHSYLWHSRMESWLHGFYLWSSEICDNRDCGEVLLQSGSYLVSFHCLRSLRVLPENVKVKQICRCILQLRMSLFWAW